MATLISDELAWAADQIVHQCGYKSAVLSGLKPDPRHLDNGGFHCSIEDLKAHGNGGDYSNTRPDDKGFNPKYGAAGDVSMSKTDMITAYGRVHAVWADKTDPRRKYLNAVNGWDGSGDAIRLDFDADVKKYASADHKWHNHFEIHRRWVRDPKAARAVASMYRGESKAAWIAREETAQPSASMNGDDMPTVDDLLNADKIPNDVNPGQPGQPGYNENMTVEWALRYGARAELARREAAAANQKLDQVLAALGKVADIAALQKTLLGAIQEIAADPGNPIQLSDAQAGQLAQLLAERMPTAAQVAKAVNDDQAARMQG